MTTHAQRDAVAREDLLRAAPFAVVRAADEVNDGFTLDGYAAVWNSPTVIDSWEGRFKEILVPGSFKKTLRERTPLLQFDHGMHPLIGSIPIGKVSSAAEDTRGVHVVARLSDNWLIEPVRDAIANESIDGMSFRWGVVREDWKFPDGTAADDDAVRSMLWSSWHLPEDQLLTRHVRELRCSELGPVVWPAYDDTSVAVRSKVTIDLGRLDSDPAQRRSLAQALYVADAVERGEATTPTTDTTRAASQEHPTGDGNTSTTTDAPPADGHPSSLSSSHRQRVHSLMAARLDIALRGANRYE